MDSLSLESLSVSIPSVGGSGRLLFSDLSIVVDVTGISIFGPNGSGKTTILDVLRGTRRPTSGRSVVSVDPSLVMYMPQNFRLALFPWLRGSRHRDIYGQFPNGFDHDVFQEGLTALKIEPLTGQIVGSMSGGEQQLLLLCLIMSCRARVFLLDEPFSAVDTRRRGLAIDFVRNRLTQLGATFVLVTHNILDALALSPRALVLSGDPDVPPRVVEEVLESGFLEVLRHEAID